jgi:hypothetical protein
MFGVHIDCLDRDNKRRTGAEAGTNTTMINSLVIANLMTDESRRLSKMKNADNKDLEVTIKLKLKTVDELRELSKHNNDETYDQLLWRLIRNYRKEQFGRI